jgi:hypothetical protein
LVNLAGSIHGGGSLEKRKLEIDAA